MPATRPLVERFWEKVHKGSGCWTWKGATVPYGYGVIRLDKPVSALVRAHRVSWELKNGPVPEGLCVLHHCDNPPCVNPSHLFLGTKNANTADMTRKGRDKARFKLGERHASKLTPSQVEEVKLALPLHYGEGRAFARRFGVNESTISAIATGKNWR